MDKLLPMASGKKATGSGFLETLLQWVASDSGIKAIIVVGALVVLFMFIKWVMNRSSSLYEEHDKLRKSLAEDREILRDQVQALLEKLEENREKLLAKDLVIQDLLCKELLYRQRLLEMGYDLKTFDEEFKDD